MVEQNKIKFHLLFLLFTLILARNAVCAEYDENTVLIGKEVTGDDPFKKFYPYYPIYFIFGKDDLKLQFSFKYRLAKDIPFYLGYAQLMFWSIYEDSKPFRDINYNPEGFFRFPEYKPLFLKSIDFGYLHSSNGKNRAESRTLNRIFARANFVSEKGKYTLGGVFQFFHNKRTIVRNDNVSFWDLKFLGRKRQFTHDDDYIDLEFKIFPGSKGYDFNRGGHTLGIIYNFGSANFTPSIYLQKYYGYAENLLEYNKKQDQYRLGLLLSY